jgi:hypothetical protein
MEHLQCVLPVAHFCALRNAEGQSPVNVETKSDWSYYEKATDGKACAAGTASSTGQVPARATECEACPANTYSSLALTACTACPAGYESDPKSGGIEECKHNDLSAIDPSKYFNAGEVWYGDRFVSAILVGLRMCRIRAIQQ